MARKPTIDASVRERARELRAGGRSREQVRKALAAEGHDVSAGWLSTAFKGDAGELGLPHLQRPADEAELLTGEAAEAFVAKHRDRPATPEDIARWDALQAKGKRRTPSPPPDSDEIDEAVSAVEDPEATLEDVREALGVLVPMLRAMLQRDGTGDDCSRCGRGASNIDGVSKLTRALIAAGALVVKTTPDVAADPNENPDMIAAATRAREKLVEMLQKAMKK